MLRRCLVRPQPFFRHALVRTTTSAILPTRYIRLASTKNPAKIIPPSSVATTLQWRSLYRKLTSSTSTLEDRFWSSLVDPRFYVTILIYFLAATILHHTITTVFFSVHLPYGVSMLPTIAAEGDWIWISKYYRHGRDCHVGDIVSFRHPVEVEGGGAVKRIVGMSGDFVLAFTPGKGAGQMLQVPQGHCWVVGDNVSESRDSRMWGPLPLALVTGKVVAKWSIGSAWLPEVLEQGLRDSIDEAIDDVD